MSARFSSLHQISQQRATVSLNLSDDPDSHHEFQAVVVRITPKEVRLVLPDPPQIEIQELFRLNRRIEILFDMPAPCPIVITVGNLTGVATSFEEGDPPMVLDLQFPMMTEDEQQALRDTNPMLVVM